MAKEKPKEVDKTKDNNHINLKVVGHHVKIKSNTSLTKLMKAYCESPAAQLEMDDEDTVDVF
ncbi:small ubiquitin-related modifier 4-like isoform X2 [Suricata suricatta]|uniref:small ubiquitin-related modifier 4-like isoform X2 n=1 Tax=Suricata suricatta TaxID=37032 RepID=UPI0011567472|nr:small ubiquitin-related modifier 4-like isoform X2 [Suricata suricatta]